MNETRDREALDFDWEEPGRIERLRRFGNKILYFFNRRMTFEQPPPDPMDRSPEGIDEPAEDKGDWYFPSDWQEPE